MTNQTPINYQSKEYAESIAMRLSTALGSVRDAEQILRSVVADMDADGNDMERGPNAPPVEDVRVMLRIASSLLAQQSSSWMGYAAHRERDERSTYDVLRQVQADIR